MWFQKNLLCSKSLEIWSTWLQQGVPTTSHKWHHRASKVLRPCNWFLPAPFHAQPELPNTCLHKLEGTLGNPRHSDLPILCIPFQGTVVMPWHTHWPWLAQQWNKAWVGSGEGYRPHSCQHMARLLLPGTLVNAQYVQRQCIGLDEGRRKVRKRLKNGQQWGRTGRAWEVGLDSEITSRSIVRLCWGMS